MLTSKVFLGAAAALLAAAAAGAGPEASETRHQIEAAVGKIQAAVQGGQSAAQVAELLYTNDIIIVGEGGAPAARGRQAALAAMEAHWASLGPDGVKRCKLALADDPGVASAETYASFFVLHCDPIPPSAEQIPDVRGIYVWKKTPHGWRVALEQWGIGKL
jgi:uncharacterized protein YbdZ (MbtH family)